MSLPKARKVLDCAAYPALLSEGARWPKRRISGAVQNAGASLEFITGMGSRLIGVWLAAFLLAVAAEASQFSIRWGSDASNVPSVEVLGAGDAALRALRESEWPIERWQKLLSIHAGDADAATDPSLPAMLGSYRVEGNTIRFQPQFPLEPGVTYLAVFRPDQLPGSSGASGGNITATFRTAPARKTPATMVTAVYPSAPVLPENLLKFYIHFNAPMRRGNSYEHIRLIDSSGKRVELPFLELDEELWNPEMTRFTVFIDPGRIKRGVTPLEEIGPALEEGRSYTLEIDPAWPDSGGLALRKGFRKAFRVDAPDRKPIAPEQWKIRPPRAGTRGRLTMDFPEPLDHALALRLIGVADSAGRAVDGTSEMSQREKRWTFTPREAWKAGRHQVRVQTAIEDLAGNNIGKPFDVDLFERGQRQFTNEVVGLPFEVR